jgi:two-component system, sensor histidine kinase RegB
MGLGIFIAQTLLERTGARLDFANLPEGGAQIALQWPRDALETRDGRRRGGPESNGRPLTQEVPA